MHFHRSTRSAVRNRFTLPREAALHHAKPVSASLRCNTGSPTHVLMHEKGIATGHDHTGSPRSVSWHCRFCQKDPCDKPVATICGHIFCQG